MLLPASAAAIAVGWDTLFHSRETIRFEPREARHALAHAFLQEGSDVVRRGDSLLVRNRDYGIDTVRGTLFLLTPAESLLVFTVVHTVPLPVVEVAHPADRAGGTASSQVSEKKSRGPQVSPVVHALPSSHEPVLLLCVHAPVAGTQASVVQTFASSQLTGFDPVQVPSTQVSVCVHASLSLHVLALFGV